jgi:hypothetical protein
LIECYNEAGNIINLSCCSITNLITGSNHFLSDGPHAERES